MVSKLTTTVITTFAREGLGPPYIHVPLFKLYIVIKLEI
jgi:hypothetical protein